MDDVIVRAAGLRKSYGDLPVLAGVDLELRRGEVLALLGPNGAGKTTTVKILATLLPFDAGRATVAGHDVAGEPARVRRHIALTGQQVALDEKLTARENLRMIARLSRVPRRRVTARVDELLAGIDLTGAADRRISTFSGGMRRRVDLAAGLVARPDVLFLDEPTTGLDPRSRRDLWVLVRDAVAAGTSLFLTTQYLDEADRLADRVALIDAGRVVADGTPDALKRTVGQARVELELATVSDAAVVVRAALHLADVPAEVGTRVAVGTDGSLEQVRELLGRVSAAGVVPQSWGLREPTLDDVFLTLTGHAARTPVVTRKEAA